MAPLTVAEFRAPGARSPIQERLPEFRRSQVSTLEICTQVGTRYDRRQLFSANFRWW
jgi:hypothetical protein